MTKEERMEPKGPPRDLKRLWRNQPTEDRPVTLDTIRENAETFQRQIRRRNLRETLAAVAVVLVFGLYVWVFPGWMIKTGSVLAIAGTLFIVWQLRRRAAANVLPEGSALTLLEFHRQELMRQRDAARSVGLWYIAPVVPGAVLMSLGRYFQFHAPGRTIAWDHQVIILCTLIVALVFAIVWLLNVWAAERLQRRIDELDKLRSA
jgi:Flp pilus assembly protein TadB